MDSIYGNDLDPMQKGRKMFGFEAKRQRIKVSHSPSTMDQNQDIEVFISGLDDNDVIVPGSIYLNFDINLTSTKKDRYIVNNLGKAIIDKVVISFCGREVQSIEDFDIWNLYKFLLKEGIFIY